MTIVTRTGRKTTGLGAEILTFLAKHGEATTEQIAAAIKCEDRAKVASRLWWLTNKEGRLKSSGKGKDRVWSLPGTTSPQEAPKQEAPAKAAPAKKKAASTRSRPKKKASAKKGAKK